MIGKLALITGGSYGIGEALAKKFSENSIDVILIARSEEKLLQVKSEIEAKGKGKVWVYPADLTKVNLAELYEEISRQHDVDLLVNNAGFGTIGYFHTLDTKKEIQMIELNVRVLVELTSYFVKDRIRKGGGGCIINLSSLAGFFPIPFFATYSATKAFVLSFSEAIRRELEDYNIKVFTVCPGGVKTEFQKRAGVSEGIYRFQNYMAVEDAVNLIWDGILKGKSPLIPGDANSIYRAIVRILPISFVTKMAKLFMKKTFIKSNKNSISSGGENM